MQEVKVTNMLYLKEVMYLGICEKKMRSAPRLSRERSTSQLCRHASLAGIFDVLSINEND